MTKEELLKQLREAVKREESATTIYLEHLSAIITRGGLSTAAVQKIRETIEYLVGTNRTHKIALEHLIKQIEGDANDVF